MAVFRVLYTVTPMPVLDIMGILLVLYTVTVLPVLENVPVPNTVSLFSFSYILLAVLKKTRLLYTLWM